MIRFLRLAIILALVTPVISSGMSANISAHARHPQLPRREVTNITRQAEQLLQKGIAEHQHGELQAALASWQQALQLYQQVRNRKGTAHALGNLGIAHTSLGNYFQALDALNQHLLIAREIDDQFGEIVTLGNLAVLYHALGDYERAIGFFEEQSNSANVSGTYRASLHDNNSYKHYFGISGENSAGFMYRWSNDYPDAIDFYRHYLGNDANVSEAEGEAQFLAIQGFSHQIFSLQKYIATGLLPFPNQFNIIREETDLSNTLVQQTFDQGSESDFVLGSVENIPDAWEEYQQALIFHEESLDIFRGIGNKQGEAISLGNLGFAYLSIGDNPRAFEFFRQQLDVLNESGNLQGEAKALGQLAAQYQTIGNYQEAINLHQKALGIFRQTGDRRGESISHHYIGTAFLSLQQPYKAEQNFQTSARIKEELYATDLDDSSRLSLWDSQQTTYRLWQKVLIDQGKVGPALEVAEGSRTQALTTSMAKQLATENDKFEPLISPNLRRIRVIAAEQQAILVEYSVLPSGRIFIWVIQPDGTIHFEESDAAALDESLVETADVFAGLGHNGRGTDTSQTPISRLVQETQTAFVTRGQSSEGQTQVSQQQLDRNLQQLHALLIEPIEQWLPPDENQRVIFIPHRELFRVPFAALQDNDDLSYLIEKHTILTAPSIQSLALSRQHHNRIQTPNAIETLVVGNPTLPDTLKEEYGWEALSGAETEAQKVSDRLSQQLGTSSEALLNNQATETLVKERLHSARFIHLATHGTLTSAIASEESNPGRTADLQYNFVPGLLALASSGRDDGSLTADELLEMTINNPLNAELVVLSACQTGQGPITSDGVYGLSRTLLAAGVPTLLVSLWNASDTHTVGLMDEFYRQFLEEDQDKAQALRQAMLKMINQGDPNPQYWAAFTLVGDAQ